MELILCVLIFNIFYHISYFLMHDIVKYYKSKHTKPYKGFYKQIVYIFSIQLISLSLPFILKKFEIPIILRFIAYLIFGLTFSKDVWIMFESKMKDKDDLYYSKYYKMDFFYIKSYINDCIETSCNEEKHKLKEISKFMEKFPYKVIIKKSKYINAFSYLDENKIIITQGCLKLPINEIKAILGHEIMHFDVDGNSSTKKRKIAFFCKLYIIFFSFGLVALTLKKAFPIVKIIFLLLLFIYIMYFIFFHLVIPERYLFQLSELKCDRLACLIEGVDKNGMLSLLERIKKYSHHSKEIWYLKIIRRYFLFESHPNINYRIKQIKKYHNWSIIDYIKIPIHLTKQLLIGKGWSDN